MANQRPARSRTTDPQQAASQRCAADDPGPGVETQLSSLEAQLDLLKAQVRQAQQLANLGTAAAMIAHEANNLLTPIRSYAQRALEEDDHELQRKALTVTIRQVGMLVAMCDRILKISAARPQARQAVSVRAAAEDAAESLCRDLAKDGIRFVLDVDESIMAWADPLQLEQVFFNLFLNARSAMEKSHNGRLKVKAARRGDEMAIEVADTGKGIPPDLLPYVFDPLQTSKPLDIDGPQRCAGLGLALCRDLVEENGGSISVASESGRGTAFTITFPVAKESVRQGIS